MIVYALMTFLCRNSDQPSMGKRTTESINMNILAQIDQSIFHVDFPEGWSALQANKEIQESTCPVHEVPPFPFQSRPW